MYRDLSALLAAKEAELTEAHQTIATLEERIATTESELQAKISALESALREATDGSDNRDAVLKNALTQRDEMMDARDRANGEIAELRATIAEHKRERLRRSRSFLTDALDSVDKWLFRK